MMARLSRRAILRALGWGAAGITATVGTACSLMPTLPPRDAPTTADLAAWISLRPDGMVEILSTRVEMGQGIAIALRQIAADELGLDIDQVRWVPPDTARIPVCRATVGSDSVRETGPLIARAAAALAQAIKAEAARRMNAAPAALAIGPGGVAGPDGRTLALADIAAGRAIHVSEAEIAAAGTALSAGRRRLVGASPPPQDIDAVVTGARALYADDIRLPGMVFGARIRPAGLTAEIAAIDDSACRAIPGYLGLFRDGNVAGIVATRRGALAQARAALVVSETAGHPTTSADIMRQVAVDDGAAGREHTILARGDTAGPFDIDLTLSVPLAAHAAIEPRTAVARFDADGRLEIWTGTQDAFFVRNTIADALGLARARVVVHAMRIGGGFGARTIVAAEMDAALLARACGRPVKVQWNRRDEFQAGFHRPPSVHRVALAADGDGNIARWHHGFRSGHIIFTSAAMGPVLQMATSLAADPGVARGAVPPYAAAAIRVEFEDVRLPVMTGPWRGLGAAANIWAMETAIDALARAKGRDPLSFRLQAIAPQHARLRAVLAAVAEMSGWAAGRGDLGLACGIYKDMSYAAAVAQVTRDGGRYRVAKLWCAQDCGLVVNPGQVRAQIEGNLVWGIGMALAEELAVADGRVAPESFFDYPLPRFSDVPDIEIRLIEGSSVPTGAGETAIVCGTAAITNAIAALTGRTVTRLPVAAA